MLLTIPVELRQQIFKVLFRSTTVSHGFGSTGTTHTSILRTCRQIHNEAKFLLAPNVFLHFKHTEAMLDCLTSMSASEIQNIRHIRLKAFPVPLYGKPPRGYSTVFNMAYVLPLFPGLELDRLPVEDSYHHERVFGDAWVDAFTYLTIKLLIESDGWKELNFISPTTEFMSSSNDEFNVRIPQPANSNEFLKDRDGAQSGAEVKMYLATEAKVAGAVEKPETRTNYDAVPGQIPPGAVMRDIAPIEPDDKPEADAREVLVVARRGKNASYAQDGSALHDIIKDLVSCMSWQEIKENYYVCPLP